MNAPVDGSRVARSTLWGRCWEAGPGLRRRGVSVLVAIRVLVVVAVELRMLGYSRALARIEAAAPKHCEHPSLPCLGPSDPDRRSALPAQSGIARIGVRAALAPDCHGLMVAMKVGGASYPGRSADARERARQLAQVVDRAAVWFPRRPLCVTRSLALLSLLHRDGLVGYIVIGAMRDDSKLRAHAWVEMEGVPVNEAPDVRSRFTILQHQGSKLGFRPGALAPREVAHLENASPME